MPAKNPYKQTAELPAWVLLVLKGGLIAVFVWQFYLQLPDDYWEEQPTQTVDINIETIEYSQLLGLTAPMPSQYLQWGDQTIYYLEPSQEFSAPFYEISPNKIKQLATSKWELMYKGQELDISSVNAVLLYKEGPPSICEGKGINCLQQYLLTLEKDVEIWLSLDTREQKRFFSKLRIGSPTVSNNPATKEAELFWEKLIKKEKFKEIDDLTVAKPVFKGNKYLFKWGQWERYVDRSLTEPRIKIDTATFKNWLRNDSPSLYKEDKFVPFYFSVGFWDRKRWDRNCFFKRESAVPPVIEAYPCLDRLLKETTVGDEISIFVYQEEDFLEQLKESEYSGGIPSFILNGRNVRLYIALELVATPISKTQRPLDLSISEFTFQLQNGLKEGPLVKMDTTNVKNLDLFTHYKTSGTAKIVHIPNFKTIGRVYNPEDNFVDPTKISKTHILVDKVYAVHTFPEFYDFDILPPTINSRGLSTVLDKTCYWLEDYINYRNPFEIKIGDEKVQLLQTNITIIPKEGDIVRYVTDNPDRYDINSYLDNLDPETSVYFDEILFERSNGERLAFPLAVALHLK